MISWRREKVQIKNDICPICNVETESDPVKEEPKTTTIKPVVKPVKKTKNVKPKIDTGLKR